MQTDPKRRLSGIQAGRGIAALAVVLTHSIDHPFPRVFEQAHFFARYGVTLFFVISGYIMVVSTGDGAFQPGIFVRNRIRRVVPLYWAAIFITASLALTLPQIFRATEFSLPYVIKSLLFIPAYSPGDGSIRPFVKLGWTLNFEMFFYLCFASMYALTATARAVALSVLFLSLIALGYLVDSENVIFKFYTRIDTLAFVAGVWLAILSRRGRSFTKGRFIIIGLTSLVIGLGLLVPYGSIRDYPWTQVCVIIMCAMQVSFLAEAPRFGWSVPRLLEIMGNGSYSIYLFHMFGVGIGTIILFKVFSQLPVLGIVISAGLGIAIGLIVYHFLEAPMDKWFRRVTADSLFSNRSIRPSESVDRL